MATTATSGRTATRVRDSSRVWFRSRPIAHVAKLRVYETFRSECRFQLSVENYRNYSVKNQVIFHRLILTYIGKLFLQADLHASDIVLKRTLFREH